MPHQHFEITTIERQRQLILSGLLVPSQGPNAFRNTTGQFSCIKEVVDFPAMVLDFARSLSDNSQSKVREKTRELFQQHKDCNAWYPYQPGHSPEWHLNDEHMQQIESERRQFELKLFEMSKKLQEDNKTIARWVGIVVIGLMLMQILEVWYFSTRRNPPIIIQIPSKQGEPPQESTPKK